MEFNQWKNFKKGDWQNEIDVRSFIQTNYTPYEGPSDFLTKPTDSTKNYGMKFLIYIKKKKKIMEF